MLQSYCNVTGGGEEYHEVCEIKVTAEFIYIIIHKPVLNN